MQTCRYCGQQRLKLDFGVALTTKRKIYRRRKCRYCYRKNKNELQKKYRQWIIDYKKHQKCTRCGISDFRVLDFHHEDERTKLFSIGDISKNGYGFERIMSEVKRCMVICANCHRILHYEKKKELVT